MAQVTLKEHFTYQKLIRFCLPSVGMMIVTSIYSVVDGFFVSNYAGKTGFAALNLIFPVLSIVSAVGFMVGAGGSSLVAFTFGQGNHDKGEEIFSMLISTLFVVGAVISAIFFAWMPQLAQLLGANEAMMHDAIMYGRISMIAMPFFFLQNCYQSFCVTAEKARLGLIVTVLAGIMNMVGDYTLVYVYQMGVTGAAIATGASQMVGAIIPTFYFMRKNNNSLLHFRRFTFDMKPIIKACTNGISEMVSNIAASLVAIIYNFELMALAGENGIAIFGVLMYVSFSFVAIFFGSSMGINPIVGYQYGANNHEELHNVYHKSLVLFGVTGVIMFTLAELFAPVISQIYVGYDAQLYEMTVSAFRIYCWSFMIFGFNIFSSAFFTGLGNGRISGIISFVRTFVAQIITVLVLPVFFGINGIWAAGILSEFLTLLVTIYYLKTQRSVYDY